MSVISHLEQKDQQKVQDAALKLLLHQPRKRERWCSMKYKISKQRPMLEECTGFDKEKDLKPDWLCLFGPENRIDYRIESGLGRFDLERLRDLRSRIDACIRELEGVRA